MRTNKLTKSLLLCWVCLTLSSSLASASTPQRPTPALLKQLFPNRKISPKQLKQFRSLSVDLNGDKRKELIVVEDPNPIRKAENKKKRCLCKAPQANAKEKRIWRALGADMKSAIYRVQLIEVKRRRRVRHRIIKVFWKPGQAEPSNPKLWLLASCQKLSKQYRRWRRWRIREVNFVRTDNGLSSTVRWRNCRRLGRYSKRRALRRLRRWVKNGAPSLLKTCPCPKKKNLAYLKAGKPLRITVAMLPAPPPKPKASQPGKGKKGKPSARKGKDDLAIPSLQNKPSATSDTAKPKSYLIIGRYQADNVQLTPLTTDSKIYAVRLTRSRQPSRQVARETVESLYLFDEGNSKRMVKIFSLKTARENDPNDPESRFWIDLSFRNMDGDNWLEIVANVYYENTDFTGMVSRKMFKWNNTKYVPLNQHRGIYRVRTSSTWNNAPRGLSRQFRKMLNLRVAATNIVDGFRDSVWVGKKKRRSVGDWIRLEFSRRMPVLGVAILTRPSSANLNPVVRSTWQGKQPPRMMPAQFIQVKTSTRYNTVTSLPSTGGIRFVRFPQAVNTQYLKLTILERFTDPKTGQRKNLTLSKKENTRGLIAEVIPVVAKAHYTASSFSKQGGDIRAPRHAGDRKKITAWAEGRSDDGVGEWLQMVLPVPQTLQKITVVNGCRRLGEKYILNNRVKSAKLTFSNGSTQDIKLKDVHKPQVIKIRPVRTRSVQLTIQSVYRGKLGHTTCITELAP